MVPEWVRGLAMAWGHEMRKFEAKLKGVSGTLGRIADEGPDGASIRGHGDYVPDVDFPLEVQKFHRAWLDLDLPKRSIIYLDFKTRAPVQGKWEKMGMSKSAYYRARAGALTDLAVSFHLYE